MPEQLNSMVFVDTETTGFDPVNDRIIEVGIIRVEKGVIVEEFQTVIKPTIPVPESSYKITGIKKKEISVAPAFKEVKDKVYSLMKGSLFVAHNAKFDYDFMEQEFLRYDMPFTLPSLCTVKLSRSLYPHYPKHNLDTLTKRFNITIEKRHRAFDDAKALWQIIQLMNEKFSREKFEYTLSSLIVPPKKATLTNSLSQTMFI
jgi:DNA polymerase-3 subunit epsilon